MSGKKATSLSLICLLLPCVLAAPAVENKEKKQLLAIPIAVGLEELLAGSLLAGGALAGASALSHVNIHSDHNSHACSGYSTKYGHTVGGWCRPSCGSYEKSVPNGSCGSYRCCIPNN